MSPRWPYGPEPALEELWHQYSPLGWPSDPALAPAPLPAVKPSLAGVGEKNPCGKPSRHIAARLTPTWAQPEEVGNTSGLPSLGR